jgi:hypothetical protein
MIKKSVAKRPLFLICLAAFAVGVVFTLAILLFGSTGELWDWAIQLAATLISATLAIVVGVGLFRYQSRKADEAKGTQLLTALAGELQSSLNILNSEHRTPIMALNGQQFGTAILMRLPPLVAEEAARSGVFDAEDTLILSNLVRDMGMHNDEVSFLLSVRAAPTTPDVLALVSKELNQRQERIAELCTELLQHLKSQNIKTPPTPTPR